MPEPDIEALRQRLTDPSSRRSTGPISCSDSPRSTIPATSSPTPPPAWSGPTHWPWPSRNGSAIAYDPAEQLRLVESVIAAFPPALFDRLAGSGLDTQRPVFIVGLPRSGTTLIEQILASHPQVHGAGEVPLARRSLEEIPELLGRTDEPMSCMSDVNAEIIGELARRHDHRLREFDGGRSERIDHQDARELLLPRTDRADVPPSRPDPLPPRPPRRGRFLLAHELQRDPMGQPFRPYRRADSRGIGD